MAAWLDPAWHCIKAAWRSVDDLVVGQDTPMGTGTLS